MSGDSHNPQEDLLNWLKAHLPEVFVEGKIDPAALKKTLGESVNEENERYGLTWAGKSNCFRVIQEPTTATLKPAREESVNFDDTENVFIEGDNLEVLKVIQKPYYGKVKMIYIDPPYNTGNDFIYNDDFKKSRKEYLDEAGEIDENGNLRSDGLMKNSKDRGHYHSDWLNMMYPRLFLARNLLSKDGVICVSIDENEVKNLKAIMDEIFGEENFAGEIVWKNSSKNDQAYVSIQHEYILFYVKNKTENGGEWKEQKEGLEEIYKAFDGFKLKHGNDWEAIHKEALNFYKQFPESNPIFDCKHYSWMDERGIYFPADISGPNYGQYRYDVTHPVTGKVCKEPSSGWRYPEKTMLQRIKDGFVHFGKDETTVPKNKTYLSETESQSLTSVKYKDGRVSSNKLETLLGGKYFTNPKDGDLLANIFRALEDTDDYIVMDFFAGSGTTAHAVMTLNAEDGGKRKCISVQLPELCDEKSEAHKAGFKTIAEICKERLRRAGKQIEEVVAEKRGHLNGLSEVYGYKNREIREVQGDMEKPAYNFDYGFKVFKLQNSNFKIWESQIADAEKLAEQMDIFVDNNKGKSDQEAVLYELIVKSGLDLNAKVEEKGGFYSINNGELVVCLAEALTQNLVDEILSGKPPKVLCLDSSFGGNDQLKTNTALQTESAGIEFKVI